MSHYKPYPAYKDSGIEWLGQMPEHWGISKLGYLSWVRARLGWKGLKAEEYVPEGFALLATPNIKGKSVDFDNVNYITQARYDESPEIKLQIGDVVLAKDGSTLGTVNIIRELPVEATVNSSLAVITPNSELDSNFLFYYLKSALVEAIIQLLKGGMGVPHLFQSDLNRFNVPLPSNGEQKAIASRLDSETSRIDALIEKKTRFIELLREKRQALITHAVTKGLDPNVKMKDSGVEWLGEVPAHWSVKPIKWLSPVQRGASPRPIDDPKYFDDEGKYGWVRIEDVSSSDGYLMGTKQKLSELGASLSVKLPIGSLFLSIAGSVGKPCISGVDACIHDGFVYFPLLKINPLWLFRVFECKTPFVGLGKMGTQLNLNTETVGGIFVGVPPAVELNGILKILQEQLARIEKIITRSERSIELLKERRSALITAAVTGQIDLREAA